MKKLYIALFGVLINTAVWAEDAAPVSFPDLDATYLKTGDFVNIADLQKVAFGQNKDQVRLLIGNPHYSEGIGNSKTWNYAFNFYTGKVGGPYVTCQYQVQYDKDTRVKGLFWREKSCEAYVNPSQPQAKPVQNVSLGADGLFAFGGSTFNDLQPVGKEKLNRLAQQIRDGYNLKSIVITGHTDRIGSDAKNMVLSQNRANTVKQYLAAQGIASNLIVTQGVGSSQPTVTCPGSASKAVIACLQPNRRVDIAIEGSAK